MVTGLVDTAGGSVDAAPPPDGAGAATVEAVRRIGRELVRPRSDAHHEQERFDDASWRALAGSGMWAAAVPSALGGRGGPLSNLTAALAAIAEEGEDLGFTLSAVAHAGLVRAAASYGTPQQCRRLLPGLLGGQVGATALTEPRGGSDVARTATVARDDGRGGLRLSGHKAHVTNAPVADVVLVLGRTAGLPPRRDITLFLVDTGRAGVRRGAHEALTGLRTSPTGDLWFKDTPVTGDDVLGTPGDGLRVLYDIISYDRLLYGIVAAAALRPQLARALDRAEQRHSFGAPIADYQYVQRRLTDVAIAIATSQAMAWAAHGKLVAADDDASSLCSIAKYVCSRELVAAAQHLMCVHGHLGYMRGPVSRFVEDALGTLLAGGTEEMQRKNIFGHLQRRRGRTQ